MKNNGKSKIPQLRFNEFLNAGEWEEKKLGEVCDIKTGNKDTQNKIDDGAYPFFVRSQTIERINSFSFDGEAILTAGDGVGVGKIYHYINGKFDFHQRVYCLYNYKDALGIFVYFIFSMKFYKHVILLSAKNSVDSVRRSMITDFKLPFPSLPEQTAIANLLQNLDQRIEKQSALIEKLKTLKKAYLQKLFPKDGENIPQLRFNEFLNAGEWEEKKLGEVSCITMGQSPKGTEYTDNKNFIVLIQGNADLKNGKIVPRIYTKEVTKTCEIGNIIMTVRAPVGDLAVTDIKACIGRGVCSLDGNKFVFYFLEFFKTINGWDKLSQGTTIDAVNSNQVKLLKISTPTLSEQTAIANLLQNLDSKIEKSQAVLELYKKEKKAYLQKLFV